MAAATTKKMTRTEMVEKLMSLHVGSRIHVDGKTYTVLSIIERGGKLCRRDMNWLEDGKPEYREVAGKYHAAGKTFQFSNAVFRTLYAQPMYMDFEVIG
jgi:hypothetical protein